MAIPTSANDRSGSSFSENIIIEVPIVITKSTSPSGALALVATRTLRRVTGPFVVAMLMTATEFIVLRPMTPLRVARSGGIVLVPSPTFASPLNLSVMYVPMSNLPR
jgi:hypothetical protein